DATRARASAAARPDALGGVPRAADRDAMAVRGLHDERGRAEPVLERRELRLLAVTDRRGVEPQLRDGSAECVAIGRAARAGVRRRDVLELGRSVVRNLDDEGAS